MKKILILLMIIVLAVTACAGEAALPEPDLSQPILTERLWTRIPDLPAPPVYETIEDNPFWEGHRERYNAAKWQIFTIRLAATVDGEVVVKFYHHLDIIQEVSELILGSFDPESKWSQSGAIKLDMPEPDTIIMAWFQDGMGTSFPVYIHPYVHPQTGEDILVRHPGVGGEIGFAMADIFYTTDLTVYDQILSLLKND